MLLIAVNLALFGWQLTLSGDRASSPELAAVGVSEREQATIELGAIPYRITHPGEDGCGVVVNEQRQRIVCAGSPDAERLLAGAQAAAEVDVSPWWLTPFSSMFLHADLLHILFNMLFLWVFGPSIEASTGRGRFIGLYLAAGLVAVYAQALLDTGATVPTIGASGAVAGVLGAYALLFPHAKVLSIFFIIFFFTLVEVPAMLLLGLWFVLQFVPAIGQVATPEIAGGGGVAYLAHVGGFLFGLAIIRLLVDRRRLPSPEPPYPVY